MTSYHLKLNNLINLFEEITLGVVEPKKRRLGPQNKPLKFGTQKNVKNLLKWKLVFEPVE
jgi:hypothetical protein